MTSIAIVGASKNREKFGNKAVRAYLSKEYLVYPINPNEKTIEGVAAYPSILDLPKKPDIVSLYVPPEIGLKVAEDIIKANITEIIINPGAESEELILKLQKSRKKTTTHMQHFSNRNKSKHVIITFVPYRTFAHY